MAFGMAGYQLVHHGEGRWNGVAIAARQGLAISDVVTNFGDGPVRDSGPGGAGAEVASEDDFDPFDEARMLAATVDGLRVVSLYAPNGRIVGSPFYAGKLAWFERLARWVARDAAAGRRARPRWRPQRGPDRRRRLGRRRRSTAARTSPSRSGPRSGRSLDLGLDGRLPGASPGARPVLVVGLPGRQLPQELRDADRPPARLADGGRRGSWTPRSTAQPARARRSRPITRRCWSTSTSPAGRSIPTGRVPSPGSAPGRSRAADRAAQAMVCRTIQPVMSSGVRTRR